jgi:hypothetical protein
VIYTNLKRGDYIKLLLSSDFLIYLEDYDIVNIPYDYIGSRRPLIAIINHDRNRRYIIGNQEDLLVASRNNIISIESAFEQAYLMFKSGKVPGVRIQNIGNFDINSAIITLVREIEFLTPE